MTFFYAWAGDENNTMMSYIDVNWDFSQFDRDNSDRFLTAAYWEAANRLAATVPAGKARGELRAADAFIGYAAAAFARHDYRAAYALSEAGYNKVVRAAKKSGADPTAAFRSLKAEADAVRKANTKIHTPHEFIDTLAPDSPRSQP